MVWGGKVKYLSDEDNDDEEEAEIGAADAEGGFEGEFVDGVAVVFPGGAEADVREADLSQSVPAIQT